MPEIKEIEVRYPELVAVMAPDLVGLGLIAQTDKYAHDLNARSIRHYTHPDQIKCPPEIIVSILLSQQKFNALVVVVDVVYPIKGHYHFFIDSITVDFDTDFAVAGYVRKEDLDHLRAQVSIEAVIQQYNAFACKEFCNNFRQLLMTQDLTACAQFFLQPELISKSLLDFRRKLYALHTEGFLTALSKQYQPLTFMYEKFHDCLTLQDLVSLRATCKNDKNLSKLTSQNLRLG